MVLKPESLIRRLEKLKEYSNDLLYMGDLTYKEYLKDKKYRYSIERLLFLISENIIDCLDHILSAQYHVVSDSYEDVIENAYKRSIISDSLYRNVKGLGGFRNILAHEYLNINDKEVYGNFIKMKKMINSIITYLEELIKTI